MCLDELTGGGRRVLEVGFWSGISFFNLHEVYAEIHAIDLTANIDEVANFFRARVFVTPLQQGDVRNMPYADGYFDSVLMISILEHLPPEDLLQALVEVRRVLRPGGQLVYGAPVERPLMVTAFRLLGTNIRSQHFSTPRRRISTARPASPSAECVFAGCLVR